MKLYQIMCQKYNNNHLFCRYGKDSDGYQKNLSTHGARRILSPTVTEKSQSFFMLPPNYLTLTICTPKVITFGAHKFIQLYCVQGLLL